VVWGHDIEAKESGIRLESWICKSNLDSADRFPPSQIAAAVDCRILRKELLGSFSS
jgi:hypothetical protein